MTITLPPRRSSARRAGRTVVVTTAAAVVLGIGGVGYAAWTVSASGTSQASSASIVNGVVSPATPSSLLYPGATTGAAFTVTNPNTFPVIYTAVSFGTVTSDDALNCPPSNVTTSNQTVSISLAAGQTSPVQTPAGSVSMLAGAPNACQGRTFSIATTVSGSSG